MSVTYHTDLIQGSDEWLAQRCGLLTASEMKKIITPTLKVADNGETRAHLWELLAQRETQYVEPAYVSDDMLRGQERIVNGDPHYHDSWHDIVGYAKLVADRLVPPGEAQ